MKPFKVGFFSSGTRLVKSPLLSSSTQIQLLNLQHSNIFVSPGLSQSLESVLGGSRPRPQMVGGFRMDQQDRLLLPGMVAHSVLIQQDPRRFSEVGLAPSPRPPPLNLKRLNLKAQRKPLILPTSGPTWSSQMVLSPPGQTQAQHQFLPPQVTPGSNLVKMAQMARSTPQLDNDIKDKDRERAREREKTQYVQNAKESFVAQVGYSF